MVLETTMKTSRPYPEMEREIKALLEKETDRTANLANIAAVLYWGLTDVNWLGFYLWNGEELVLGPFHGKSATTRIRSENGVCGVAFAAREVQRVEDVLNFPGHIP
jgi:GAF domain-containing protein